VYSKYPHLVLGFHGTDEKIADKVIQKKETLEYKNNPYDWLGHGVYFWESNPERAMEYACELQKRGKLNKPAVVGAVLDLGNCLNLLDSKYLSFVKSAYKFYSDFCQKENILIARNKDIGGSSDLLLRHLDCAVIETLHGMRNDEKLDAFSSVRGAFLEGAPLYENAGFKEKNHIQICIRNPNCIKGLFYPLDKHADYDIP